jgi:hypothetical protein
MSDLNAAYEQLARPWTHDQLADHYRKAKRRAEPMPECDQDPLIRRPVTMLATAIPACPTFSVAALAALIGAAAVASAQTTLPLQAVGWQNEPLPGVVCQARSPIRLHNHTAQISHTAFGNVNSFGSDPDLVRVAAAYDVTYGKLGGVGPAASVDAVCSNMTAWTRTTLGSGRRPAAHRSCGLKTRTATPSRSLSCQRVDSAREYIALILSSRSLRTS